MLDNTPHQPTKFKIKNWVGINDDLCGTYRTGSQIIFKTSMLKSSLCDYNDPYILVSGTISVGNAASQSADANKNSKKVVFENCPPFTDYMSEINNTQVDNAKEVDIVMSMYNLKEYGDDYLKLSERLWQ